MAKGNCASNGLARATARSTSRCRRGLTRVPTSGTDQRRCAARWWHEAPRCCDISNGDPLAISRSACERPARAGIRDAASGKDFCKGRSPRSRGPSRTRALPPDELVPEEATGGDAHKLHLRRPA